MKKRALLQSSFLVSLFLLNLINGVDDGIAEAVLFQGGNADDGGTAWGTDRIFQLAGMLLRFDGHFACASQHLRGQGIGGISGQAVFTARIAQCFDEHGCKGRAAAGYGAGDIHVVPVNKTDNADGF